MERTCLPYCCCQFQFGGNELQPMVVTLLSHKNCTSHQELMAGRLSVNDMENILYYIVLLLIVFVSHLKTTALL